MSSIGERDSKERDAEDRDVQERDAKEWDAEERNAKEPNCQEQEDQELVSKAKTRPISESQHCKVHHIKKRDTVERGFYQTLKRDLLVRFLDRELHILHQERELEAQLRDWELQVHQHDQEVDMFNREVDANVRWYGALEREEYVEEREKDTQKWERELEKEMRMLRLADQQLELQFQQRVRELANEKYEVEMGLEGWLQWQELQQERKLQVPARSSGLDCFFSPSTAPLLLILPFAALVLWQVWQPPL